MHIYLSCALFCSISQQIEWSEEYNVHLVYYKFDSDDNDETTMEEEYSSLTEVLSWAKEANEDWYVGITEALEEEERMENKKRLRERQIRYRYE